MNRIEPVYKINNNSKREKNNYKRTKLGDNKEKQFNTILSEIMKEMKI